MAISNSTDNVTPIPTPKAAKRGPKDIAKQISAVVQSIHVTFCTLEAASAALEKAENDNDLDLWVRAARVVQRCCEDLNTIRDEAVHAEDIANIYAREVANG